MQNKNVYEHKSDRIQLPQNITYNSYYYDWYNAAQKVNVFWKTHRM